MDGIRLEPVIGALFIVVPILMLNVLGIVALETVLLASALTIVAGFFMIPVFWGIGVLARRCCIICKKVGRRDFTIDTTLRWLNAINHHVCVRKVLQSPKEFSDEVLWLAMDTYEHLQRQEKSRQVMVELDAERQQKNAERLQKIQVQLERGE